MQNAQTTTKPATGKGLAASKRAAKAPSSPATAQTAPAQGGSTNPAPAVAVRGGLVLNTVALVPGKVYRTKAPHNVAWWAAIAKACATGPAQVAPLLVSSSNPQGVPVAFLGYCVRRGYLAAA